MIMQDYRFSNKPWGTIIIGGGQAGLAAGYYLKKMNEDFLILDSGARTGDSWRSRWSSLRLITPAWAAGLPGMKFPAPGKSFPTKNATADFMAAYKDAYDLPVVYHSEVIRVAELTNLRGAVSNGYEVRTRSNIFLTNRVIIATGHYNAPRIPAFSSQLTGVSKQLHSSEYKSASALPCGDVLVIGAGLSGLQIALDLSREGRKVTLAGKPARHIPDTVFKYFGKQFVWFATHILNTGTPIGRKAQRSMKAKGAGGPLIGISIKDVKKAGVRHLPRITGPMSGWPISETGEVMLIPTVIWATGYQADYSWLRLAGAIGEDGYPVAERGISSTHRGLYFIGSMFQHGLTSTWVGGVGRDAEFICRNIEKSLSKQRLSVVYP